MPITDFRTLGRSGLVVSPLALGTMTFGAARWGSADDASEAVFDAYVEADGNLVDTADVYAGGRSEELVGEYVAARGLRDRLVLATKYTFNAQPGNPNAGGNGRKNLHRAIEGSLRRLKTDYVDLFWLHAWDVVTPAEEVVESLAEIVRSGKARYVGLSDVPAWVATRVATLAQAQGVPGPIALQVEYSLVARSVESEIVPAARELGLGVMPWSPLGGGFLTGKYSRGEAGTTSAGGTGRLSGSNPFGDSKFTDANWAVLDALRAVATEVGRTPAEVALAWTLARPAVSCVLVGARTAEQLRGNLASLDLALAPEQTAALDAAGSRGSAYAMDQISSPEVNRMIFGGHTVRGWR